MDREEFSVTQVHTILCSTSLDKMKLFLTEIMNIRFFFFFNLFLVRRCVFLLTNREKKSKSIMYIALVCYCFYIL